MYPAPTEEKASCRENDSSVGAASQHVLRMTFVPEAEAISFDIEIVRDVTSPLFHLPLRMGNVGVGSAEERHAAALWTAWQSVIPTLMDATDSPDTDALFDSADCSTSNPPSHDK